MLKLEYPLRTVNVSPNLEFHMFPRLEEFTYSFLIASTPMLKVYPALFKFLRPSQTSKISCGLQTLNMNLDLTDLERSDPTDNSWVARLTASVANSTWVTLDSILTNKHYFPAVRKVTISLKFKKYARSTVDRNGLQEEVQAALLKVFSASIKALIPLEIKVNIDLRDRS